MYGFGSTTYDTIYASKINNVVTLTIKGCYSASSDNDFYTSTQLPEKLRPLINYYPTINIIYDEVEALGSAMISAGGNLYIYKGSYTNNWAGVTNKGFRAFSVSYIAADYSW